MNKEPMFRNLDTINITSFCVVCFSDNNNNSQAVYNKNPE